MVEMLGVLAVIGVLSIGGIQGYIMAMNKYRANNIITELNIAVMVHGIQQVNTVYVYPVGQANIVI